MKRSSPRGFTLIEMGIVLGIAAILAAAIVPDLIETMRNKMAEKAASDVISLQDAARLFFAENTARGRRWPGETSAGQCGVGFNFNNFKLDVIGQGYLATGSGAANPFSNISQNFMMNPWGQPYEVSLYAPSTATGPPACLFGVSTVVPSTVSEVFISFLPQAACGSGCPGAAPPAGMSRCCSHVTKPGATVLAACGTRPLNRDPTTGVLSCK